MAVSLHIPMCNSQICEPHIRQLNVILTHLGCSIEDDTQINGQFSYQFKKNLNDCDFTILHCCQSLWQRISNKEETLKLIDNNQLKVICISFGKRQLTTASEPMDIFFTDFNVQFIASNQAIKTLANNIFEKSRKHLKSTIRRSVEPIVPDNSLNIYAYHQPNTLFVHLDRLYAQATHGSLSQSGKLVKYPDAVGNIYMPTAYVRMGPRDVLGSCLIDFTKMKEIADLKELITQVNDKDNFNISFFLNKVIPELYNNSCVVGLATVAICKNNMLAERSVSMLEMLIFRGQLCNSSIIIDQLQTAQRLIADSVLLHSQRVEGAKPCKSQDDQSIKEDLFIKRLCSLLILLNLEELQKYSNADNLHNFIDDLRINLNKCKSNDSIKIFISFMDSITKLKKMQKEILKEYSVDELLKMSREVWSKESSLTLVYVFQCLKKLFQTMETTIVTIFEKCLKTKPLFGEASVNSMIADVIYRGLANFVTYCLKEASDKNIHAICVEVCSLISSKSMQQSVKEKMYVQKALLFDPSPEIRRRTISMLEKKGEYSDKLEDYILNEIEFLLCPYLTIESTVQRTTEKIIRSGRFNQTPVIIEIHRPTTLEHKEDQTTEQTQFKHMLDILTKLNHDKIMKLFAYRLDTIPQFYVKEYYTTNLQQLLANRNENRKFCDKKTLLNYLLQTSSALEFCHNNNIIHCNLTAASIFIVRESCVVLGEFHIAVDIGKSEEIILDDTSFIPLRWSAPETLKSCTVSRKSDMFMFGHLMYEVLSHGALPYSHEDLTDEEYVLRVVYFLLLLNKESCFDDRQYKLMLRCAQHSPVQRPNISDVRLKLMDLIRTPDIDVTGKEYLDLQRSLLKPSVNFRRGIPRSNFFRTKTDEYVIPLSLKGRDLTDTIQQSKVGPCYLLRERIKRNFPENLITEVHKGALYSVIPLFHIRKLSDELTHSFVVDIFVPVTCYGVMLSMSSQCRRVLNSPVHYLQMILKVAQMVQKVHQKHFVLGELKASTLFVDSTDDDIKVYPISLAQLNFSCDSSSDVAFEVSVNRSNFKDAGNIHSSVENDIHSLGNLMMEVFIKVDSLDDLQTDYDVIDAKRTSLCRPKSCPESIYQIMKKCFSAQPQERPKLQEIIRVINLELESVKKVSSELGNLIPKTSGCSPSFDPGCISKVMNPSESSSSSSSSSHSLDRTKKHVHIQKRKKIFKKLNPINSKCSTEIETMQKHLKYRPQHSIYSQNPMAERQLTPLPKNNFFTSICVESVSEKGHSINISKINTKDDTFIPSLNLEVSPTDNRQQHSYDNANDRIESDDNLTYVLIKSHSCSKHFINQPSPDHDLLDGSLIKTESHYLDTSNDLIHNDYKAIYI